MDTSTFADEQMAGQRLMVGFEGSDLNDDLKFLIRKFKIGGIILFSNNIRNPEQLKSLCDSAQSFAVASGLPPLLISIDQEGGQVARLKKPFTQFRGNPHIKTEKDAVSFADITAQELSRAGVNMNMAPVLDVAPDHFESIMRRRIFGEDPVWVSKMGATVIRHLQKRKIMAVAKHFPGIGRTTLDSHLDLPVMEDDLASLEAFDLIPFHSAIREDVSAVMLSHVFYRKIDPKWPASLSKRIARDLLRKEMGYAGVVMTDDLDMGAIKKYYDIKTVIERVLVSDVDIALICHKGPDIADAFDIIHGLMRTSPELKSMGVIANQRILDLKRKYI